MRIAILGQSYPPMISGAALFTCHLAEGLAKRGHKVLVLAASDTGKTYLQERGNLTIQRLRSHPNPHRVGQRFLLWPAKEILSALRTFRPEVIHLHDPFLMAYCARFYARRTGVPCIITIHALPTLVSVLAPEIPKLKQAIENCLWKYATWLCKQIDVEVTPTETISKMITERIGVHPLVVSGGVDMEIFHPAPPRSQEAANLREEFGINPKARIILHVGRLDAGKNVQAIIRATRLTIQALPSKDVHLLIAGDGCEKQRLQELACELDIINHCHFTGYISDPKRLAAIYGMADLFCMASEIETQGLVLLEAAACGLPFVGVDATAIHEIIKDNVNGFLVRPGDMRGLAGRMTSIMQDPGLSKRMGFASRQASLGHDFTRTVQAYEGIYLAAIKDHATSTISNKSMIHQATVKAGGACSQRHYFNPQE